MHSFTESFQIAKSLVARIVGKGGARLQDLVRGIDARVDIREEEDESDIVKIVLEGTEAGVSQLQRKIEEIVDDMVIYVLEKANELETYGYNSS